MMTRRAADPTTPWLHFREAGNAPAGLLGSRGVVGGGNPGVLVGMGASCAQPAAQPLVSVTVVTHNSRRYIDRCLEAVFRQSYARLEVIILDNASTDGTAERLARYGTRARILLNSRNSGFAAGQNQAIAASSGDWVLTLNPDARLAPDFIERLVAVGAAHGEAGSLCGKLLRARSDLSAPAIRTIDSTGIYFTPNMRHFDRGWNEPDDGRYGAMEYVFGASAAAALYRRETIEGVSLGGGFFAPDFFAYREDADVAWRAQLMGWRCIYVPDAVGYHVRRVVPEYRRQTPAVLRMHSVKNRFLMRIHNATGGVWLRLWIPVALRDLLVVAGCVLIEPRSLPAFARLAACLPRALANRRDVMSRRIASDDYILEWFQDLPASRPLDVRSPNRAPHAPGIGLRAHAAAAPD